jgi:hypothetical protein
MRRQSSTTLAFERLEQRVLLNGASELSHSESVLSAARFGLGAASVDGNAVFWGGTTLQDNGPAFDGRVGDIYNVNSGTWSSFTSPDGTNQENPAAVSAGDLAIFAGGGNPFASSDGLEIYDAAANTWVTDKLSEGRNGIAATAVGEYVLFAGGLNITGSFPEQTGSVAKFADVYNSRTGRWSRLSFSDARPDMVAATVGDMAIFAGGVHLDRNGVSQPTDLVDFYDADSGTWSTGTLPVAATFTSIAVVGTKVLFSGDTAKRAAGLVEMYDSVTRQWSTENLSGVRMGQHAVVVGDKALFADSTNVGTVASQSSVVMVYDGATSEWSQTHLSGARTSLAATGAGNEAIFAGGVSDSRDSAVVDLFKDTHPTVELSGAMARTGNSVAVRIINSGDATLKGLFHVQVYATSGGHGSVKVGDIAVTQPLAADQSLRVAIPLSFAEVVSSGKYHLVAAISYSDHMTSIASLASAQSLTSPQVNQPITFPEIEKEASNEKGDGGPANASVLEA